MSDITFHVTISKEKLDAMLDRSEIERRAAPVVKKYAFVIEGKAKQNAPVLTGFLKNSLQAKQGKTPANWEIADGTEYGIYQELGTSRGIAPKFFLTQASESTADDFFNELVDIFK